MGNFHKNFHKVVIIASLITLSAIVIWMINPIPLLAGFIIGSVVSIANIYILYRNVVSMTEVTNAKQNLMRMSGLSWRVFFVIIAVLFAERMDQVHVFATVFGAFFAQMVAYIYFLIQACITKD